MRRFLSKTKRLRVPNWKVPVSAAIFAFSVPITLPAQDVSNTLAKMPGNVKCWEAAESIVAEAGVAADNAQGYFAASNGKIFAVELDTGDISWGSEVGGEFGSEIVVSDGSVFIVASRSVGGEVARPVLRSLSTKSGLANWNLELPTSAKYYIEPTPEGVLAVSADGAVYHLKNADGTILWRSSASGPITISPRLEGGRLLVATAGHTVEEFDVADGRRISLVKAEAMPAYVGAGNNATAVYSDPKGGVYSIKTGGTRNWKFRSGGRITFIKPVSESVLLGSADNFVYFMSVGDGNLKWKRRLPGRVANGGLIGDNMAVFTVIGERSAYVIELDKGRLVDQISLSGEDTFLLTPVRANGKYLLAATQNGLSAFSAECGNEKSGD